MAEFIRNVPLNCPYCKGYIREGRVRKTPIGTDNVYVECIWICSNCGQVARRDERRITKDEARLL